MLSSTSSYIIQNYFNALAKGLKLGHKDLPKVTLKYFCRTKSLRIYKKYTMNGQKDESMLVRYHNLQLKKSNATG